MRWGRWYPTNTALPNGEVVTIAGRDQKGATVRYAGGLDRKRLARADRRPSLPYYPRMFVAPNGRSSMPARRRAARYLSTSGTGSWTLGPKRLFGARDYGAAVMYEPGKILYAGGGRTTSSAETIDSTRPTPSWRWTGSMAYPRRHHNATILPTGEVLVTGGSSGTELQRPDLGVRAAEIWNPATGKWTTLASNVVTRVYHGTSVLLPDGRVLHAGSGDATAGGWNGGSGEMNASFSRRPICSRAPGRRSRAGRLS